MSALPKTRVNSITVQQVYYSEYRMELSDSGAEKHWDLVTNYKPSEQHSNAANPEVKPLLLLSIVTLPIGKCG